MAVDIRRFDRGQLDEVVDLYRRVFSSAAADQFRSRWEWSQEHNGMPDETLQWCLLSGARVVGFLGTVPQRFLIGDRPVLVHYPCDYMVHPDHRFHGIALMREYFRECESCVSLDDMPATIAVLKMMKARPVLESVRFRCVLDARAVPDRFPRLQALPGIVWSPVNAALSTFDALRAWAGPRVTELPDFDDRFDRFLEKTLAIAPVSLVRDRAYLSWRYGASSPHPGRRIGAVLGEGQELQGYVVGGVSSTGRKDVGHVLELHVLPGGSPGAFGALLAFAGRRLREDGVRLLRFNRLPGATSIPEAALRGSRFQRQPAGHVLLVRFRDETLEALASDPASWAYSFGDAEASHSA